MGIMLMDEAFSALDPLIRSDMQKQLLDLQSELKKTIVFITHDLDESLRLGDHIGILNAGKLVQVGTPVDIIMNPADDYVKAFVKDVNRAKVIKAKVIMKDTNNADDIDKSSLIKVNEDQFIEEFLPQIVCPNSNCEVVDKSGNVKGYISNKKFIISAGASGIGLATAKVCLSRGAYVYLCDIDNKSLNKLNKHPLINKRLFKYNCDASDESQVLDLFKKISKKTKKIDALINNVGVAGPTGSLEKLKSKDWERTIQIDVNSHFYFTKKTIPLIKKSKNGSIINISSTAGILGFPLRSPYAASK